MEIYKKTCTYRLSYEEFLKKLGIKGKFVDVDGTFTGEVETVEVKVEI